MDMKDSIKIKTALTKLQEELDKPEKKSAYKLNFFRILGLSANEIIHSKFISFLLNPNASHDCKYIFQDEFMEILKQKDNADISAVFKCNSVGREEEIEDGRVDIILTNENEKYIIIENKIYAQDGDEQLKRYSGYKNSNPTLVYLTLNGKKASRKSLGGLGDKDYIRLSYIDDITKWISNCMDAINDKEMKYLLNEYLQMVKELTKYNIKKEILPDLLNDISLGEVFDSVKTSNDLNEESKDHIIRNIKAYIIETYFCGNDKCSFLNKLCAETGCDWEISELKYTTLKDWGFSIFKKEDVNNKIKFIFEREVFENCCCYYKNEKLQTPELPDEYKNWHKNVLEQIMNKDTKGLFEVIKEIINKFITGV